MTKPSGLTSAMGELDQNGVEIHVHSGRPLRVPNGDQRALSAITSICRRRARRPTGDAIALPVADDVVAGGDQRSYAAMGLACS